MIYKRFAANLRAQNWFAIFVELAIVIVGVFIGTLVANANEARLEKAETEHRLRQLQPELSKIIIRSASVRDYYATTRRYAHVAFAGWARDPKVSDSDFVIAAYQASQIRGMATTSQSWADLMGADNLRNVEEAAIRDPMLRLITYPAENLSQTRVQTEYRDDVRTIIPDDVQEAVRENCGDYIKSPQALDNALHDTCPLSLDPAVAAQVAADLRRKPEMVGELRLHLALVASQLSDIKIFDTAAKLLLTQLRRREGTHP